MGLSFEEYSRKAGKFAIYPNRGNNLFYALLGLGEEAGECMGKGKRILRDDGGVLTEARKDEIVKELGDTAWYLAACAFEIGVDLETIFSTNLDKLEDRAKRGKLHGSGDNR
jgi:NTP pyrophosphatase (non-canonical NTP hydrolase)